MNWRFLFSSPWLIFSQGLTSQQQSFASLFYTTRKSFIDILNSSWFLSKHKESINFGTLHNLQFLLGHIAAYKYRIVAHGRWWWWCHFHFLLNWGISGTKGKARQGSENFSVKQSNYSVKHHFIPPLGSPTITSFYPSEKITSSHLHHFNPLAAQLLHHFTPSGQFTPSFLHHFTPPPWQPNYYIILPHWQPNSYIILPALDNLPLTLTPFYPPLATQLLHHFIPSEQNTPSFLHHFTPPGSPTITSFYPSEQVTSSLLYHFNRLCSPTLTSF